MASAWDIDSLFEVESTQAHSLPHETQQSKPVLDEFKISSGTDLTRDQYMEKDDSLIASNTSSKPYLSSSSLTIGDSKKQTVGVVLPHQSKKPRQEEPTTHDLIFGLLTN